MSQARLDWREHRILTAAIGVGLVCSGLAVTLAGRLANDTAAYYGRLAHEFAVGNYDRAFFHMIPPLVPTLGGVLGKLGFEPFTALKIVSFAFFLAALWPLHRLLRRTLPGHLAEWGCLLYVICPRLLRYSTRGTLESAKVFFLLLVIERALAGFRPSTWRAAAVLGVGLAGLSLARGEGIIFVPFALLVAIISETRGSRESPRRAVGRAVAGSLGALLVFAVLCSPWAMYEARTVGVACLDSRQVQGMKQLLHGAGLGPAAPSLGRSLPGVTTLPRARSRRARTPARMLGAAAKGLFVPYVLLAFGGLAVAATRRERRLRWHDAVCGCVIVLNALIFASRGMMASRYTSATIPFLIGWAVLGGERLVRATRSLSAISERMRLRLLHAALAATVGVCVWDGMHKALTSRLRGEDFERDAGMWLRANREDLDVNSGPALQSDSWGKSYHNGRQPVVVSRVPQFAYWGRTDLVTLDGDLEYPYESLVALCRVKHADVLITHEDFSRICPEFAAMNVHFEPVSDAWLNRGTVVYVFRADGLDAQ